VSTPTLYNQDYRLAIIRIEKSLEMARKELGCEKKDYLCCSDSKTLIKPLPGYD
jgi:hypothetical protein